MTFALGMAAGISGLHSKLPLPATVGMIIAVTVLVIAIAERFIPYEQVWNQSHNDVGTDVIHNLVSITFIPTLARVLLAAIFWIIAKSVTLPALNIWPENWPIAAQVALACVVAEFGSYWIHRLAHEKDWLWRLHATHHSALRIYWLNAARDHPLGSLLFYSVEILPLLILQAPSEVIVLETLATSQLGLFQHANVDYRLGPLNYIFSLGELHRWHHSRNVAEANHNYGSNLILWDLLFGSFFWPKQRPPQNVGIDFPDFPQNYLTQLWVPFRWSKLQNNPLR